MRVPIRSGVCISLVAGLLAFGAAQASAAAPAPGWTIDPIAVPTNFSANHNAQCMEELQNEGVGPVCDHYQVEVRNAGSESSTGSPITIVDTLPTGVTVQNVELYRSGPMGGLRRGKAFDKSVAAGCTTGSVVRCELTEAETPVGADATLVLFINVTVDPNALGPLTNAVAVAGGGAVAVSASHKNPIASAPPPFGPANFDFHIAGRDGAPDTLAGDHPYEVTTTIDLNSLSEKGGLSSYYVFTSAQFLKDVVVDLPLGFAGSTLAAPQCALSQLSSRGGGGSGCPPDTVVGHIRTEPQAGESVFSPIWNLTPEHGVPAEFGFEDLGANPHVFYAHVAPTTAGYVLRVTNLEIPQIDVEHIVVTFFGDPAERAGLGNVKIPFFTNPTACSGGPLKTTIWIDSWQHPGSYKSDGTPNLEGDPNWVSKTSESPAVTGCNALRFEPELLSQPTVSMADSPSGLEFDLKLPQPEIEGARATPALRNATVTFPAGVTIDPSAGNGLQACSVAQIGWLGGSPFNFSPAQPECPDASKIGTLELETPLLARKLEGAIYLAAQNENPFGSTFATYVVVNDPVTGVVLKIAGELKLDPTTGRITSFFPENAQLPFSDLKLHFFGGPRASLATPEACGIFTTTSDLEPWSAPGSGPHAMPFDSFPINEGCGGGFAPKFTALSTNVQAGAYTSFVASFSRQDSEQELAGLTLTLPPGLLANVGSVPECTEAEIHAAEADTGGCPASTQVGTVTSFAGPGPNPLSIGGKAYWTGPYKGGSFGLVVVVPAIAGPFKFGNVVVRQSLRIDPHTAQTTDVSDPFPTFLHPRGANGQESGVPIKLRRIDVAIDRPGFTFNPTNCSKLQATGSLVSVNGASSSLATPFQVTNCQSLKFQPKFTVSTSGKTSKTKGASLTTTLSEPAGSLGAQANIHLVKVELPIALPSRLTTLQKACTNAQFELNPANCPAASKVGIAVVHTQLLPVPLVGPAIFVSHGGEAFPSLTMVLQGDNVTVELVGTTHISPSGITSTTFKTLPDTPFESFTLTLPEGPFSALAANGNLCNQKLVMPNEFVAQNGATIYQRTNISVTGCKPAIHVVRHKATGKTATVVVSVPSAGKLAASGNGLSSATAKSGGAGNVTVRLTLSKKTQSLLARHHGRKLKTHINLRFTPRHGSSLSTSVTVLVG